MTADAFRAFAATAEDVRLRAPYVPVIVGPPSETDELNDEIIAVLGELSERAKLSWLLDCVAHAAEILDREAKVAEGFVGLARAIVAGQYMPSAELRAQIDKYQAVFEHAVARANQNRTTRDMCMANVLFVLGTLLGYLFRAVAWFETEAEPPATWLQMAHGKNGVLPLWQVLDGSASSRGGIEERRWQIGALARYRSRA